MPRDIHPLYLVRDDGTKVNYSQLLPYFSKEGYEHWEALANLQTVFTDLFTHVRREVSEQYCICQNHLFTTISFRYIFQRNMKVCLQWQIYCLQAIYLLFIHFNLGF